MSQGIQESPADSDDRMEELGEEGLGVPGRRLRKGSGLRNGKLESPGEKEDSHWGEGERV